MHGNPVIRPARCHGRSNKACISACAEPQRAPAEQGGGEVAFADRCISPAAIGVLVSDQPARPGGNQRLMFLRIHAMQRYHGGGGAQRAAGQLAFPVTTGISK